MMLNKISIGLFFIALVSLISCKSSTTEESQNSEKSLDSISVVTETGTKFPEPGSINGDTINLQGKFVLFYGPADESSDTTMKTYRETTKIIIDSLVKAGDLNVAYTTVTNFRVNQKGGFPMILSIAGFDSNKGMLLMDGQQPPAISKGALKIEEYHESIKKYFLRP
ncbi:MAG: hypothetical protein IPP71_14580 [Bacteroidetes bacterium]|nr:hypothetical protein [Bacteroidota bacterium]